MKAKRQDPEKEYESLCEKGIRFIPHFTDEYPEKLKRISDYPYALYVKGRLPDPKRRTVAVIGARMCSLWKDAGIPVCESVKCSWSPDYQRYGTWH